MLVIRVAYIRGGAYIWGGLIFGILQYTMQIIILNHPEVSKYKIFSEAAPQLV